mgnify:CR=1 FL=1
MLSQTTEYALRAVVYLANHPASPRSIEQIAESTHVPGSYLSKVMQGLRKQGLVQSQRGSGGGFLLAISAEDLTVFDVVQAVDPIKRIDHCPLGIQDHLNLCPLHRRLDHAIGLLEQALKESTIAELLTEPEKSKGIPIPLCPWPESEA